MTGDTPIGFGANVIPTRLNGADIVAIAGVVSRISYTLFARPGITSPADLRGKTMVGTLPGALVDVGHADHPAPLRAGARPRRGDPAHPGHARAVHPDGRKGWPTPRCSRRRRTSRPREAGLAELANISDLRIPFMQTAHRHHARLRPRPRRGGRPLPARVRRGDGRWRGDDAASTKAIIGKYTQTDDDAVLDDSYTYFRDIWGRPDFRVPPEAIASILRVLDIPGAATAQATDFIDNHFIDELEQEGFMQQVGAAD